MEMRERRDIPRLNSRVSRVCEECHEIKRCGMYARKADDQTEYPYLCPRATPRRSSRDDQL